MTQVAQGRSFTINPAKSHPLGDGVYIRRWHRDGGHGVEVGVRNGDHEFQNILLTPDVIQQLLKYLYIEGHQYHTPTPPATERAANPS